MAQVRVHMKIHEHAYGEPLLLTAEPGLLARGPGLGFGVWAVWGFVFGILGLRVWGLWFKLL